MKTFILPDLGEGLHDATVIEWYANDKQTLKQGERLLAVETAKAIVEIPAPEDLSINKILAPANTVLKVGMPLLDYEPMVAISEATSTATENASTGHSASGHSSASVSVVGTLAEADKSQSQRHFIMGAERFSADEIAKVERRLNSSTRRDTATVPSQAPTSIPATPQTLTLSGSRLAMCQQLSNAHQQVALVTLFDEVAVKWPAKTRPLPRLIQALCAACLAEPKLNAWFDGSRLQLHSHVNIGLAVNTPQGLFVPVLKHADTLSSQELSLQLGKLQHDAHEHRLHAEQLHGATISLSNFGMLAGRFATPMVVPPQVAIIGVGRVEHRTLLTAKGKAKTRQIIPLSLSFDHRALTGAEAATFLAAMMIALQDT